MSAKEDLARRSKSIRDKYKAREAAVITTTVGTTTGTLQGILEGGDIVPEAVAGFPVKLGLGLGVLGISLAVNGIPGQVIKAIGDAELTCYGYAAGKKGSFVAGDDDDDDPEDTENE